MAEIWQQIVFWFFAVMITGAAIPADGGRSAY